MDKCIECAEWLNAFFINTFLNLKFGGAPVNSVVFFQLVLSRRQVWPSGPYGVLHYTFTGVMAWPASLRPLTNIHIIHTIMGVVIKSNMEGSRCLMTHISVFMLSKMWVSIYVCYVHERVLSCSAFSGIGAVCCSWELWLSGWKIWPPRSMKDLEVLYLNS